MESKEEWKKIEGFESYLISNKGRVKSTPFFRRAAYNGYMTKEIILKPKKTTKGYYHYELKKNGISKTFRAHRLVAIYFIDNPNNYPEVNHINGIKTDNRVENLEWISSSENQKHAYRIGLKKAAYLGKRGKLHNQSIPVIAVKDTTILEFENKTMCGEYLNVSVQAVCQSIKNNTKCKGYKLYL